MPEETKPTPQPQQQIITMNTQLVYANQVTINLSQSDVTLIFAINGRPVIATALTLPVAKNLQNMLDKVLSNYENKTNSKIPDIREITEQLKTP